MLAVNTAKCARCEHHDPTSIFELCNHPTATYYSPRDDFEQSLKPQQHTVGHMRRHECGVEARLFKEKR